MRVSVQIKGMKELEKQIAKLEKLHKQDEFKDALAKGGQVAVVEAKRRVPVATGDLRDSLHVGGYTKLSPGYRRIGAYGALPGPKGSGTKVGILVGTTLPYGHLVEMGTSRTHAQPFLRPAVDGKQKQIVAAVDEGVQEIIDGGD